MPEVRRSGRSHEVTDRDYARLLAVRTGLRQFERWSAEQAAGHGLTTSQHQLMLAIRGHADPQGPTITEVADYLLVRHHSAVELVDRSVRAGLVERVGDTHDHRVVRLRVTTAGTRILADLSDVHLEELSRMRPLFESMLEALHARGPRHG